MKTAIYPGSFDPVTSGHLDIIRRAANIFDKLIVCVMVNAGKHPMFSLEERVELIRRVAAKGHRVSYMIVSEAGASVYSASPLAAEVFPQFDVNLRSAVYARRRGSCVVVKGLRAGSDFENEFQMALINRKIYPELDTMFLTSDSQYMFLSSSIVKELGSYGADLTDFIPEAIIPDFRRRLEERSANK